MWYNIDYVKKRIEENPKTPIIYFWGHTPNPKKITASCLSQWYDCQFVVKGVTYHTAEQFMMAMKASFFKDKEILEKIMNENHPSAYKKLGRQIKNFDSKTWDEVKYDIVVDGNIAKFSQNEELKKFLLSTEDAILVEASPYDRIWGIGIDKDTAMKGGVDQWQGENLLGFALMEVRDELIKQEYIEETIKLI